MIREERPVVFTVSDRGNNMCKIVTKDSRGVEENVYNAYKDEVFKTMLDLTEVLNDKGYAVLFEVD